MSKLRIEGEALASVMSGCGSPISSWMSDLSMGSEGDQSLHSFSQSQSQQGEALAEPEPNLVFGEEGLGSCDGCGSPRRGSVEGEVVLSKTGSSKGTPTKDRLRKMPPSMAKTNIQILTGPGNLSPFKTTVCVHPCVAVKPMVIQEPTILSSPNKTALMKDPSKCTATHLASLSSEMSFEDPWLKRGVEEVKPGKRESEQPKSQTGAGNGDYRSLCKEGKQGRTGLINSTEM